MRNPPADLVADTRPEAIQLRTVFSLTPHRFAAARADRYAEDAAMSAA
jgi:hypothetical protein